MASRIGADQLTFRVAGAPARRLPMSDFERLPPHRLSALSDEELVAYTAAARAAGERGGERDGLEQLAFRWEPTISAKVAMKVPEQDREDVIIEVQISLINASFDGKLIGQFGAFVRTITHRRIADYHREISRRRESAILAGGGGEDDDQEGQVIPVSEDGAAVADLLAVVDAVLATREPLHQKVIRLYGPEVAGFLNMSAAEVKAAIEADGSGDTVSINNVAQIWRRFKVDLERELDG